MTTTDIRRPRFDPEFGAMLTVLAEAMPPTITPEMIPAMRGAVIPGMPTPSEILEAAGLVARDVTIPGYEGDDIVVSVVHAAGRTGTGPGFYHTHGGGMIIGDRWTGIAALAEWLHRYNGAAVTVEYRLAPEFPDPYPVEDCYAGLVWTAEHADELGIEPGRLPPAFIDCGSAEVFRDEDVAYATAIWADGGDAELHVWPGGYHAFEGFAPQSRLAQEMTAARDNWIRRILG